jgi:hypothetical protein
VSCCDLYGKLTAVIGSNRLQLTPPWFKAKEKLVDNDEDMDKKESAI